MRSTPPRPLTLRLNIPIGRVAATTVATTMVASVAGGMAAPDTVSGIGRLPPTLSGAQPSPGTVQFGPSSCLGGGPNLGKSARSEVVVEVRVPITKEFGGIKHEHLTVIGDLGFGHSAITRVKERCECRSRQVRT